MNYKRFGKTEKNISEITLGGMRFAHGWDEPRDDLPGDSIENCYQITKKAFDLGINHIETAYGYMKSEGLYGQVLSQINRPRDSYYLMTKGNAADSDEMKKMVDDQLAVLKTDYIDFYAFHGINDREVMDNTLKKGGALDLLLDYKRQGIIKHVGFSTHGPLDVIMDSIATDKFDFLNLHYYYFFQRNFPAIVQAGLKDMGILIISSIEKGGMLWDPPPKLKKLTNPLTPIQFNGRFCLSHSEITTLSLGIHEISHFAQDLPILKSGSYVDSDYLEVKSKVDSQIHLLSGEYCDGCAKCLPCPEQINIPEVLRMRNMYYGWDMEKFGKFRYNLFDPDNNWFQGRFADACTDCGDCLDKCHLSLDIPTLLKDAHKVFFVPKEKK